MLLNMTYQSVFSRIVLILRHSMLFLAFKEFVILCLSHKVFQLFFLSHSNFNQPCGLLGIFSVQLFRRVLQFLVDLKESARYGGVT